MSWYDDTGVLRAGRPPGSQNKVQRIRAKDEFNSWTVIRRAGKLPNGQLKFLCECVCGTRRKVLGCHLVRNASRSCGCSRPSGKQHYKWGGCGDITGDYWSQIKRCATREKGRSYSLEFSLTIEYAWKLFLSQKRRCALTGQKLTINWRGKSHTASLDRIDSSVGYVEGNVQWVHKDINMMKRTLPQERFVELCLMVAAHSQEG